MGKNLSEEENQQVEDAIEDLFNAEPGSEDAKKFKSLVRLVRRQALCSLHQECEEPTGREESPPRGSRN